MANWFAIYNRLFKLIDRPIPLYYSGPTFIRHVQEVQADFPYYTEYIKDRTFEGKSTTRATYFGDIFFGLGEDKRFALVSNILNELEKYEPADCAEIRTLMFGSVAAPSATIPVHAWNADRLNEYLKDMDSAIAEGKYPLAVTLSYTCLEGFFGAFLRAQSPRDEYPKEIVQLSILARDHVKSMYKECPHEVLNNISHAAYAVNRARDGFSDSHFGDEAAVWLATYVRDLVNTQIRLLLHFM